MDDGGELPLGPTGGGWWPAASLLGLVFLASALAAHQGWVSGSLLLTADLGISPTASPFLFGGIVLLELFIVWFAAQVAQGLVVWLIQRGVLMQVGSGLVIATGAGLVCLAFLTEPPKGDSLMVHRIGFSVMGLLIGGFGGFSLYLIRRDS